jgi:hypothetical protein
MYAAWKDAPVTVDLDKFWSELGIHRSENGLVFDETAPLAKIREAIAGGSLRKSLSDHEANGAKRSIGA